MDRLVRCFFSAVMVAGLVWLASPPAGAETFNLELKKLAAQSRYSRSPDNDDYMYRMTYSQSIMFETGDGRSNPSGKSFSSLVKKEPEKYEYENPFRGVISFGEDNYLFVLDTTDLKSKGFHRLYFDRNHNFDLTDDGMIEADPPPEGISFGEGSASRNFPAQEITLTNGGSEYAYSFSLDCYSNVNMQMGNNRPIYAYLSVNSAAYREGQIEVDGKTHKVVILDFNGNGRFDDENDINEDVRSNNNRLYFNHGDMLILDPDLTNKDFRGYAITDRPERNPVSKLLCIDGKFYNMRITPSGDKINITPSRFETGFITNPNDKYEAMVYSDLGFVKIKGAKSEQVPLPEGDWKLLEYAIDATDANASREKGRQPYTFVTATATTDCKAITVKKGASVELPFGPPYAPKVTANSMRSGSDKQLRLSMDLVGSAGESCTNLMVNGNRPDEPRFAIATLGNEVVERGKFEYG